ncbi:MAG: energy transducer TonB [Bacteroidota bacterium]
MKTSVYADLDQIVFEGRHQGYGAFQLRKRYHRYLQRAVLVTFLVFICLTLFPKIADWVLPEADTVVEEIPVVSVTLADLPPPPAIDEEVPELAPPPPPEPPRVRTIAFLIPEPVADELVNDSATIAEVEALDSAVIALMDQEGDDPGEFNYNFDEFGDGPPRDDVVIKQEAPADPKPEDFVLLEKEPTPVNMDELQKSIGYPELAFQAEIEGRVSLRILVDKQGNYVKHIVLRNPHPILTNAVTKHIHKLKVTPGIQAGRPIRVWVTVPFNFKLL